MRIKRVVQGTALAALAAAAWMGAGSDASAAVTNAEISNDNTGYKLSIQADSSDVEIAVGVATVNKNKEAKVTVWDVYDGNSATVDLSKLNVAKDNYFAVKTNDMSTPAFYKIPAAAKKVKAKYDAASAKVSEFTADSADVLKDTGFQYRTVNSDWVSATKDTDLSQFQYQGATLYLRRMPVAPEASTEEIKDITINKKSPVTVTATVLSTLPTKEVKLNIAKQAKGPSVAVDYVKGTVKLKANTEYRFVSATQRYAATSNSAVDAVMAETFIEENEIKGVLEVRTAAVTNGTKSKCASKWTRVDIEKPVALTASATIDNTDCSAATTASSIDLVTTGGALKAQFTADKKGTANGLALTNGTSISLDYCFSADTPSAATKFKVMKASATKPVNIKAADLATGNLYIRVSGVKADKKWAGEWTSFGKVELPK
ncbi:MAG: hypothetical protein K2K35_06810 [Lachnospiraceae bacterium]|nr:hypothetical protein [Lachnospiraceae bacterium]